MTPRDDLPLHPLDPAERDALATLDHKLKLVDDRVAAVVRGYQTGFYLYGAAGLGKSYTVLRKLQALQETQTVRFDAEGGFTTVWSGESTHTDLRFFNSRMTAKGLFRTLEKAPRAIHVLEDMERLTSDRDAQGVLRSALWAQSGQDRECTWTTGEADRRFAFRGGIIMLANRPLTDLPELRALATRIAVHQLDVTPLELAAQMRRIAAAGFTRDDFRGRGRHYLEPGPCLEICAFVLRQCRTTGCALDLRLFDNACLDFLLWESGGSGCHWQDLVASRIRQSAGHFRADGHRLTRAERLEQEQQLVQEICAATAEPEQRLRLWRERTGKSQGTFYRRKAQVDRGALDR